MIFIGLTATLLSFAISLLIVAAFYTSSFYKSLQNILAPLLAVPHLGIAVGIAFLLAPSGFFFRLVAQLLNWQQPPQLAIVPDHWGLTMVLALCLKEVPFLLFMINGALGQIDASAYLKVSRSLGYYPFVGWFKVILPQIYPKIRLPLFIVLIFSLSVVDIALLLAPNAPPPYPALMLEWFYDSRLENRLMTAAGGVFFIALILFISVLCYGGEKLIAFIGVRRIYGGRRGRLTRHIAFSSYLLLAMLVLLAFGSLLMMLLWSFARSWRFPSLMPQGFSWHNWASCELCGEIGSSLFIALTVSLFSVLVIVALLEGKREKIRLINPLWFCLPLFVPQIVFLFGFDLLLLTLDVPRWAAVLWAHFFYVLPYAFLLLQVSYLNFDIRYERTACALGHSRFSTWFRIKLPILFRPIMYTLAIGFAVSINEYLPTLIAGKGEIQTLTTEMVALAAGGDRRIIGVTAITQSMLPFIIFIIALVLPNFQARNRRGLAL